MNRKECELFEIAVNLFESQQYGQAVEYFIKAYEEGYDNNQIIDILNRCYINPNENEFKKNYDMLDEQMFPVPYENLSIDFIPISDSIFYLYDKKEKCFCGLINLEEINNFKSENDYEFESIFIADTWDIRDIYKIILEKKWNTVYLLQENNADKFYSFFKLPQLTSLLNNAVIFKSVEVMKIFFEEYPNIYLPKILATAKNKLYKDIFNELHTKRLNNKKYNRDNILLSIGIPSYQRGERAWNCVNNILKCQYDSEIEIVVSNNGSDDAEYYDKIKNLNDSRIKYFEFDENQGYTSNVCKVLELSRGRFCVFTSDEDEMLIENLPIFLKYLINNLELGYIMMSGIGQNMCQVKTQIINEGVDAIICGLGCNYLTGCCFNLYEISNQNILGFVRNNRGNCYLEYYIHCVIAAYLGRTNKSAYSDIILFKAGESQPITNEAGLLSYMEVESRIEQQISCLQLMIHWFMDFRDKALFIFDRCDRTFFLLSLAYNLYGDGFGKGTNWRIICRKVFEKDLDYLDNNFCDEELNFFRTNIYNIYINWVVSENVVENKLLLYKISNCIIKELVEQKKHISCTEIELIDNKVTNFLKDI